MKAAEIRQKFLDFFREKGHEIVPSSSLVPREDPSLLFTSAGMVQFKRVFLGEEQRPYRRAASVQKCLRVGGKHNDLEQVGITARHHTFFEMLGNFSFGDYFKQEAIAMAWEFLTRHLGLPADRLWATVYQEDDEAHDLWRRVVGLAPERIIRLGRKDNFWQMGDTGPCGPCSEIIVDQGPSVGCGRPTCKVGCDCGRYLELWNLVFMQYDLQPDGTLRPLPRPSIDTGMGLERVAAVAQGVKSNYDTDLFRPLLDAVASRAGARYGEDPRRDLSLRVIADHLRAIAFLVADGVLPSNEGRGYVLRRVIRRAARHGRLLGLEGPFLYQEVGRVVDQMKGSYPGLSLSSNTIVEVARSEEERFANTLDQGLSILQDVIARVRERGQDRIPGEDLFRLYDTYGFPLDLVTDVAQEQGLGLDQEGFDAAMARQRERARRAWAGAEEVADGRRYRDLFATTGPTRFVGYGQVEEEARLVGILRDGQRVSQAKEGETVELVFDVTPFYGESGGQVGDQGTVWAPGGEAQVVDTQRPQPDGYLHIARVTRGEMVEGERYRLLVNPRARDAISGNHTGTHLLHATLREVLGDHVKQAGSLVAADRLRFDFTHFRLLTARDLARIEEVLNSRIRHAYSVRATWMDRDAALASGALAFFGDRYGERVRVVEIGDFSRELCGGTHTHVTGELGLMRLVHEGSVAAGVRRIEALTGEAAYLYARRQEEDLREVAAALKVQPAEAVERARRLVGELRQLEREAERVRQTRAVGPVEDLLRGVRMIDGVAAVAGEVKSENPKELRAVSDAVRARLKSGVVCLAARTESGVAMLIAVTKDLAGRYAASELIREVAAIVGGTGGGRPDLAQAGGQKPEKLPEAFEKFYDLIARRAKGEQKERSKGEQ